MYIYIEFSFFFIEDMVHLWVNMCASSLDVLVDDDDFFSTLTEYSLFVCLFRMRCGSLWNVTESHGSTLKKISTTSRISLILSRKDLQEFMLHIDFFFKAYRNYRNWCPWKNPSIQLSFIDDRAALIGQWRGDYNSTRTDKNQIAIWIRVKNHSIIIHQINKRV